SIHSSATQAKPNPSFDMPHGLDQEPLPLVRFDATDHNDLIAVAVVAKPLGRENGWIKWRRINPIEMLKPVGDDLRIGVDAPCFPNRSRIQANDRISERSSRRIVRNEAVRTIPEVIQAADVMNEPQNLVGMGDHMCWRTDCDEPIARSGDI